MANLPHCPTRDRTRGRSATQHYCCLELWQICHRCTIFWTLHHSPIILDNFGCPPHRSPHNFVFGGERAASCSGWAAAVVRRTTHLRATAIWGWAATMRQLTRSKAMVCGGVWHVARGDERPHWDGRRAPEMRCLFWEQQHGGLVGKGNNKPRWARYDMPGDGEAGGGGLGRRGRGGGEAAGREGVHASPIPSRKLTNVGHDDNDYGFLPLKNNNQPTMVCRVDEACNREVG